MPDDKDLTRALNFIVRVQPESAEAYARDMEDLNKRREQLHAQSEKRVSTATTEESEKRFKAAKSDLDKLEDETVSKYDKEMERLAKLRVANEEKYSDVVKLAREAARQEKDISDTLITTNSTLRTLP
jgi:ppGpp synthetase/RelA/SpoT-type nucleotidyltranferase